MGSSSAMDSRTEPHSPEHTAASDDDKSNRPATPLSLDARAPRPARLLATAGSGTTGHGGHSSAIQATVDLASVMAVVASNPVSPGPSSPPLPQARAQDFVPPTRPSSTPFPQPEQRTDDLRCLGCPDGMEHDKDYDNDEHNEPMDVDMDMDVDMGMNMGMDSDTGMTLYLCECESDLPTGKPVSKQDVPASPRSVSMDLLDLSSLDRDGEQDIDYLQLASSSIAAEPRDMSTVLEVSAMHTTPSLSPISTAASSLGSPNSTNFDSYLEYPPNEEQQPKAEPETETEAATTPTKKQQLFLQDMPMEIQQLILDHVFDCRVSPMTKSWPDKRLTKMASFTRVWRTLIQKRLYCRIKLKATGMTLFSTISHFAEFPHLRSYVRHVELWFPVFQPKTAPPALSSVSTIPTVTIDGLSNATYTLPSNNCSLEEAFFVLSTTFPELSVLTLEGGERKKAPQVQHFADERYESFHVPPDPADLVESSSEFLAGSELAPFSSLPQQKLPEIRTVRTLVCRGQWNLIRHVQDYQNIMDALPNLRDWQGAYSKPKSKSYLTMATILPRIPTTNLTSLNLCLEGDYRQEISFPPYFLKVIDQLHFCVHLAEATPNLEHLSYTGRVCRSFFDFAARLAEPRTTRLKSIDLTVKNCCRHVNHWHESGSGVTDLNFIRSFEALVLSGVRSLERLTKIDHLRVRYVDLEFPVPPLNPFFLLQNGQASGVWSDTIVSELNRVRPDVCWEELSESIGERTLSKDGRLIINAEFPKKRVVSLKLSNYAFLVALATM